MIESNGFSSLTYSHHRLPASLFSCHGDERVQRRHVVYGRILDGDGQSGDAINQRS